MPRIKAADLDDVDVLRAVEQLTYPAPTVCVWDLADHLHVPTKVANAKARKLIRRGFLNGCWCGCRGDLQLVDMH